MTDPTETTEPSGGPPALPRSPARWRRVLISLAALVGVAVAYTVFRPHTFAGTVLQSPEPAPALDGLVFSTGEAADLSAFAGDVVLVFFGYTHCPDICPVTLARAAQAKEAMGSDGEGLQVLMVSVDPERDTPEVMAEYMGLFDDSFLGVTGPEADIDRVATLYGIGVIRHDDTADHTGTLMAIDPDGHLRIVYPHDVDPAALAADLARLLKG